MKYLIIATLLIGISLASSCLTFENIENKILIDNSITVLIRNCGDKNLYDVNVALKYLENFETKKIAIILPNEIKYLKFNINLPKGITKALASLYAYNNETFISANFFLIKPEEFIKIEVPEISIEKDKQKEIFVKIKNDGNFEIEKTLELELQKGIIGYFEEDKVKILPRSEKNVKLILVGKEVGEKYILIRFGNFEKIVKVNVYESKKDFQIDFSFFLPLLIAILLALVFISLLRLILKRSKECILPEI
ncbi:MAG: hypothetical protein QXQ14_02545 [Candidatus Aenigmatarchaeota archaeon]